jgi:SRSO17 transposase
MDRQEPLKNYCKALLSPGERKSIEPMAARLDPDNVQPMRQSLHKAPWSDQAMLEQVRNHVLPTMQKHGPLAG